MAKTAIKAAIISSIMTAVLMNSCCIADFFLHCCGWGTRGTQSSDVVQKEDPPPDKVKVKARGKKKLEETVLLPQPYGDEDKDKGREVILLPPPYPAKK